MTVTRRTLLCTPACRVVRDLPGNIVAFGEMGNRQHLGRCPAAGAAGWRVRDDATGRGTGLDR